jgi:hypothetical protein
MSASETSFVDAELPALLDDQRRLGNQRLRDQDVGAGLPDAEELAETSLSPGLARSVVSDASRPILTASAAPAKPGLADSATARTVATIARARVVIPVLL